MHDTQVIIKTVVEKEVVPIHLIANCPAPALPELGDSNGKLAEYVIKLEHALKNCNIDKESIRKWQTTEQTQ